MNEVYGGEGNRGGTMKGLKGRKVSKEPQHGVAWTDASPPRGGLMRGG